MRIIGGEHRGRRIAAPPGKLTRPMLDRVREAVFSAIAPRLDGAYVLDLFAGSGSLGLEALSRGARFVRCVERDRRTVGLLRENAASLGLEGSIEVVGGDALAPSTWGEELADLVFLDPPYAMIGGAPTRKRVLSALGTIFAERLAPDGLVVFHVPRGLVEPASFPPAMAARERIYGTNALWFLKTANAEQGAGREREPEREPECEPD